MGCQDQAHGVIFHVRRDHDLADKLLEILRAPGMDADKALELLESAP